MIGLTIHVFAASAITLYRWTKKPSNHHQYDILKVLRTIPKALFMCFFIIGYLLVVSQINRRIYGCMEVILSEWMKR